MNLTEFFSVILVFLHCNVGIGCLEMTLDGFELCPLYYRRRPCNKTASVWIYAVGRIVLNVGEQLPKYVIYEEHCEPSEECLTWPGSGSWEQIDKMSTQEYCLVNISHFGFVGCNLLSERTYKFWVQIADYYTSRLCKYRVQSCDESLDDSKEALSCGPFSVEHHVSEISTESRYGYDTSEDEKFRLYEKKCRDRKQRAAWNGKEGERHLSDDIMRIFGAVLAINWIVFY